MKYSTKEQCSLQELIDKGLPVSLKFVSCLKIVEDAKEKPDETKTVNGDISSGHKPKEAVETKAKDESREPVKDSKPADTKDEEKKPEENKRRTFIGMYLNLYIKTCLFRKF